MTEKTFTEKAENFVEQWYTDKETGEIVRPRYKNTGNAQLFPSKGEVNNEPSKTIPDQTMTISEMIERHSKGLPIDGGKVPIYNGEDYPFKDTTNMDLAERQEYLESLADELVDLRRKIDADKAEKTEQQRIQELENAVQKRLEEKEKQESQENKGAK